MKNDLLLSCWKEYRGGYNLTASEAYQYIREYVDNGKYQNYQDAIVSEVYEAAFCKRNDC